jgi:hypothetical protein
MVAEMDSQEADQAVQVEVQEQLVLTNQDFQLQQEQAFQVKVIQVLNKIFQDQAFKAVEQEAEEQEQQEQVL